MVITQLDKDLFRWAQLFRQIKPGEDWIAKNQETKDMLVVFISEISTLKPMEINGMLGRPDGNYGIVKRVRARINQNTYREFRNQLIDVLNI